MSYILTKLHGVIRSPVVIKRHLQIVRCNYLPGNRLGIKNQNLALTELYSTKAVMPKNYESRMPKILEKLSSNKVSLQFDRLTKIRPNLFKNYSITVENGFNILNSCSQLVDRRVDERLKLVNDTWNELVRMIETPNKSQLIVMLQAFRRAGLEMFNNHREFFEKYDCPIDTDIYTELLYILCQNGPNMKAAEHLLEEMMTAQIKPNDKMYNALILGYSKQGMDDVEKVLNKMKMEQIAPTSDTYTELIKAYIHNECNEKAIELLQKSRDFNSDQLYAIIRTAALKGNEEIVARTLKLLPMAMQHAKSIARELQNICTELVHSNRFLGNINARIDPYQVIIQHLPVPTFVNESTTEYGTFLIKEMIVARESVSNVLGFCAKLIESHRNVYAIHSCCMYSLVFNLPDARDYLEALAAKESLRPHYFWPLFVQANDQNEVIDVIKFANKLNVILDIPTLQTYVLPRMNTLASSEETVKILVDLKVRMAELKTAVIVYLLEVNRPKEALDIACRSTSVIDPHIILPALRNFVKGSKYERNAHTVATLVKRLQTQKHAQQYDLAGELVQAVCNKHDRTDGFVRTKQLISDYEKLEVKISQNSAKNLLAKLNRNPKMHAELRPVIENLVSNVLFSELNLEEPNDRKTDLDIDALEKELATFQANGFPTHGTLYRLFMKNVQHEQWNRALEIKKKCDEIGVNETPAMQGSLLRLWTATNDIDKALDLLATLKQSSTFKVDAYKIHDLAKVLITMDRFDEAVKIINDLAPFGNKNTDQVSFNIFHLLNAACDYGVKHNTMENIAASLLQTLVERGHCEYTNRLLGTVMREHLEKKNIRAAVATFEHSVQMHTKTPQSLTLLTNLVELTNSDRLEDYDISRDEIIENVQHVIALIKDIHGTENANVSVILAFACAGNEQQLRKIFMNPDVVFNTDILIKSLKYLKDKAKIEAVVAIARSARGLRHGCLEEEKLYELLLNEFVGKNDYASAIQLYDQIKCDDDSLITKKFCSILIELLAKNEQQIPAKLRIKST